MKGSSWYRLLVLVCFMALIATFNSCMKEAGLPTLLTGEVSNIGTRSAVFEGNITDEGGARVELRGFCWGTADNPTIEGYKKYCKDNNGSFTFTVTGLVPNTYYHVRAFAVNRTGTAFGNEVHFRTNQIILPEVTTTKVESWGYTSGGAEGIVEASNETLIIEKGFCYATTEYPTTGDRVVSCGSGAGIYSGIIENLKPGTIYYVRAYAITFEGATYGDPLWFITAYPPSIITDTVTNITRTNATTDVKIISNGVLDLDEVGVCFGTNPATVAKSNVVSVDTIRNEGIFTFTISNLNPGTVYYVRSYVYLLDWYWWRSPFEEFYKYIIYGNEVTFTTNN